jgi:eukaryotic-like serine/threonine-protein kinase
MTARDLAELQTLFEALVALPSDARAQRLRDISDIEMRDRLVRMLAADGATSHGIDKPAMQSSTLLDVAGLGPGKTPSISRIGRYSVERVLGEGGMGVVYLARQNAPERLVAIKVIRSIAPSPDLIKRFEREATVLARLSHPGIAQIFDSGSAPIFGTQPVPYLVLEYIEGTPLLAHVEAAKTAESERLRLFIDICRAVQYAHQRGVIHRDLKPANILVQPIATGDTSGTHHLRVQSKILDFGVARTLEDTSSQHTQAGTLIGTLSYMSPEQVAGTTADTRSDVYALGVILFELLSGRLPIDVRHDSIASATRKIREDEPLRLRAVAAMASADLEAIALKAIEKDPVRRYQSAGELADDIERFLANLPVLAQPPSSGYQLRKFAARNRVGVAAAVAVAASVLAFGGLAAWQAVEAIRASRLAEMQAQRAEAVKNYLVRDLVRAAPPDGEGPDGGATRITDYFDRAITRLPTAFPDKPDLQGEIRSEIGYALAFAGEPTKAIEQTKLGLEQLESSTSALDARTLRARAAHADALQLAGLNEESQVVADRALADLRTLPAPPTELLAQVQVLRAELASNANRFEECEAIIAEVQAMNLPERSEHRMAMLSTQVGALMAQDKWPEAEAALRALIASSDEYYGPNHPHALAAASNLIVCLYQQQKTAEAIAIAPDVLARAERTFGPTHPSLAFVLLHVGGIYGVAGETDRSIATLTRSRDIFIKNFDDYRYEIERVNTGLLRESANNKDIAGVNRWAEDFLRIRFGVANKDERASLKRRLELNHDHTARAGAPETIEEQFLVFLAKVESLTPPGHARRARTFVNLARAAEDLGRIDLTADLCAKAREALATSGQRADDEAILAQTPCTPAAQ